MILYANIDDLALIIQDVLPQELFKKVSNYNYNSNELLSSYKDWQKELYEDSSKNKTMRKVETLNSLAVYEKDTFPILEFFKSRIIHIDSNAKEQEIYNLLKLKINKNIQPVT